mgnify:FL=1
MQYMFDICAVVIAAVIIFTCARKGFFLTILSFFKFLLSVLAAYFFGGRLGALLGNAFINQAVYDSIYKKFNEIYVSASGSFNVESIKSAIPKFLQTDDMMAKLNGLEGSGAELVESMAGTVSDALSAVICTVLGAVLMFLIAMLVLTIVYAILKAIKSKIKLLGIADGVLGAVFGCLISCIALMLFGSLVKLFFGNTDAYAASKLVKFFGDATVSDFFGWLNIGKWIDKIKG